MCMHARDAVTFAMMTTVTPFLQLLSTVFLLFVCSSVQNLVDDTDLVSKVLTSIGTYEQDGVMVGRRSLVIYHVGEPNHSESPDLAENNIKLFVSAIQQHSKSAEHQAYYIFRIDNGKLNVLFPLLPQNLPNVALLKSSNKFSYLQTHIQTVHMLGDSVALKFHSILFLNHYARGPFEDRKNGGWWKHLIQPFENNHRLGLLGSTISCEVTPHVQSYAFIMKTKIALDVFAPYHPRRAASVKRNAERLEFAISNSTMELGYDIASLYYQRRHNKTVFDRKCVEGWRGDSSLVLRNPGGWCDVLPQHTLFLRWGSLPYRGFYCEDVIESVTEAVVAIAREEKDLNLVLPETIEGGHFYALTKEYNQEVWKDRSVVPHKTLSAPKPGEQQQKVCFLVRSAVTQAKNTTTKTVAMDLHEFIKCKPCNFFSSSLYCISHTQLLHLTALVFVPLLLALLRQSSPNWEAYFFITDNQPFDKELQAILAKYGDVRLSYLEIDNKFRPKVRDRSIIASLSMRLAGYNVMLTFSLLCFCCYYLFSMTQLTPRTRRPTRPCAYYPSVLSARG